LIDFHLEHLIFKVVMLKIVDLLID